MSQTPLRRRIRELAAVRVKAGYRQIHVILRREGWRINHKRTYRLYREEGLALKPRRPRRHRSATLRVARRRPTSPNEQWAMDFMHDTLADGRSIRVLTAIDLCTRECLALVVAQRFTGNMVAEILSELGKPRGQLPDKIRVDNGLSSKSRVISWPHLTITALSAC